MSRLVTLPKLGLLLTVLAIGAAGTWAYLRGSPGSDPSIECDDGNSANLVETLASLPPAANPSAVDQAITRWSQWVAARPEDNNAWAELGEALMQKARETADSSYYGHAEKAYRKALALRGSNVTATVGIAWVHSCRHEFERSVEWANKALALDPKNPWAYGLLGDADLELGDYDAAFEHFQKMLDLRPNLSSYSRAATALFLTGDSRKASLLMGRAIAAGGPYPENIAWCKAQLAWMHFQTGNHLIAEQFLQEALQTQPNNFHLLAALGRIKAMRKEEAAAALEYLQKAAAIAPQHDVLVALGDVYQNLGQPDEAEKQYELVEATHRLQKANGVRGDAQMARFYADHDRKLDEALQIAEAEYKTYKGVFATDTLAWCYFKNGRLEDAKRTIRKALARKTPDAHLLFHAGMIYAKLGERVEAQLYLSQAVSTNPHFSPVYAPQAFAALNELGSKPPE